MFSFLWVAILNEPRREKTGIWGFRPGLTKKPVCAAIEDGWMREISDYGRRGIVRTSHVAKTKALISFSVTAKLICAFVFAKAKIRFPHDTAQI